MKITFKFIIFLIYVILLFWVKNLYVFLGIFIFQMLLIKITNISFKKAIKNIINLLPFIIFTAVFNLLTMGWKSSIQITIRLILICNITYIFGKTTTAMQIAQAIQNLLYPLKYFGINTKNVTLIISISITFIPIIIEEITNIKYTLIARGMEMSFLNQIKHINYIMKPLFYSLLRKVNEIEESLKSKAYIE